MRTTKRRSSTLKKYLTKKTNLHENDTSWINLEQTRTGKVHLISYIFRRKMREVKVLNNQPKLTIQEFFNFSKNVYQNYKFKFSAKSNKVYTE